MMKLTRNNPQGKLVITRSGRANSTISDPLHLPISKPLESIKSGYLNKRGQLNPDWKRRYFMLDHQHLYYFKTDKDDKFTGVIQLLFSSIRKMDPNDPENSDASPNCWKIITPTRVFFLQADNPQAVEDWMQAISAVCCALWEQENVIGKNPETQTKNDIIKQGFLLKRGNNVVKDWKQRWFVLKDQYVAYYNAKTDYTPLGTIRLLQCSIKVSQTMTKKHCLEFVTPSRTFYACAANDKEMREWMEAIKASINSTLEAFFEKNSAPKAPPNSLNNSTSTTPTSSSSMPPSPTVNRSNTVASLRKNFSTTDIPASGAQNRSTVDVEVMQTYQNRQNNNNSNSNYTTSVQKVDNSQNATKTEPKSLSSSQETKVTTPSQDNNSTEPSHSQENGEECQLPDKTLASMMEEVLSIPENKICAECDSPDPKWASINIGIFICIECSGIHRSLGVHVSKVRSVQLDDWDTDTLEFMHSMGNKKARELWEFKVLPGYTRPQPNSPRNIKTIWIQAKYQDRLFADPDIIKPLAPPPETTGGKQIITEAPYKEGFLNKLGSKEDLIKAWKKRWFILKNNNLYYYIQREDAIPTGMIRLTGAYVRVAATNQGREHAFEIVTPNRVYIIAADDSPDMAAWINYLKLSIQYFEEKARALKRLPSAEVQDDNRDSFVYDEQTTIRRHTLVLREQSIKRKGYLFKKGNNLIKDWRKRWFVLYKTSLYYYESEDHQNDQLPLGILELESVEITISKEVPKKFYFELCTPNRIYYLYAESREDMQDWIKILKECMKDAKARANEITTKRKSTLRAQYQAIPSFLQEQPSSSGRSGSISASKTTVQPTTSRASFIRDRQPSNPPPAHTQQQQQSTQPQTQPQQQNSSASSNSSSGFSSSSSNNNTTGSHYQRIPTFS